MSPPVPLLPAALLISCLHSHILLLGATTENPSFRLAAALLSRLRVFVLRRLEVQDIELLLRRARDKATKEWGWKGEVQEDLLSWIAGMADGDARYVDSKRDASSVLTLRDTRTALNTLELALASTEPGIEADTGAGTAGDANMHANGEAKVPSEPASDASPDAPQPADAADDRLAKLKTALRRSALLYDRTGDKHYDTVRKGSPEGKQLVTSSIKPWSDRSRRCTSRSAAAMRRRPCIG